MEFDKSRVYTAVNADELRAGDKVITALCMADLRALVESNAEPSVIEVIQDETNTYRFTCNRQNKDMANWRYDVPLAYLVERKENCTNCDCCVCAERNWASDLGNERIYCCPKYKPKTEKEDNMNWNYVSEGKLPERQEIGTSDRVVVAVRGYNIVDIGYYDYDLEGWFVEGNRYPVNVYAWHYDKPPRVEA